MAVIFTDDFNRSDRNLNGDNGWTVTFNHLQIESGVVYLRNNWQDVAYRTLPSGSDDLTAQVDYTPASLPGEVTLLLRGASDLSTYYRFSYLPGGGTNPNTDLAYIAKVINYNFTSLAQVDNVTPVSGVVVLQAEALGTTLTLKVAGVSIVSANDSAIPTGLAMAVRIINQDSTLDNLVVNGAVLATLDIGPYPVEVYPETADLDLLGTGTAWTPGTPGSPTFQVDIGVIEAQTVADATDATLTYKPPAGGGSPTFTDPSTGATKQITTELFDPPTINDKLNLVLLHLPTDVPNPGNMWLEAWNTLQQLIALGQDGSGNNGNITILAYLVPLVGDLQRNIGDITPWRSASDPPPAKKIKEQIGDLINSSVDIDTNVLAMRTPSLFTLADVLNAIVDPTADLTTIKNQLTAIRTASDLTLQSVVDQLQGLNTVTLTAIYNLVSDLQGTGLHTVKELWDLLNLIPTNPIVSLQPLLDQWAAWRTVANYTVQDLLDAIAAVRGVDNRNLTTLYNLVNSIPTNPITSLQPLLDQWAAWRTASNYTVQTILDRIGQVQPNTNTTLSTLLTAIQNAGVVKPSAPVWPGLAGVTLGAPVNLAVGVTVNGPLHGVLIHVTAVGSNRQHFTFDTDKSQVRIGAITFQTDNGYDEFSQLLGFEQGIYTPRSMAVASKALLRCGSDIAGTVTPWTIN